ncbi:hypothetical protein D9M68_716680 [compost metagenome]
MWQFRPRNSSKNHKLGPYCVGVSVRRTAFLTTGLLSGGGRADLLSHGPWQQFADAIDGVVGDARNDVAQVGLGVEAVQLG